MKPKSRSLPVAISIACLVAAASVGAAVNIRGIVYDAGTNSLYADVPIYPFGNGGIYPTGAGITTDAHGDILCGGVPSAHFDHFVETVTVKPACALTNQQLVVEHAPQLQAAFDNAFGPGRLTITAETAGPLARIRIKPTNAGCTLTGGGGSVVLTQ